MPTETIKPLRILFPKNEKIEAHEISPGLSVVWDLKTIRYSRDDSRLEVSQNGSCCLFGR